MDFIESAIYTDPSKMQIKYYITLTLSLSRSWERELAFMDSLDFRDSPRFTGIHKIQRSDIEFQALATSLL